MRCASENREQHDQFASLPRTQPCWPQLPALANTCALLASNDARARIHFQQLARPGPPAHPRATSMRWAGESGAGKHTCATCHQRRTRSDPLQATCARPGPPAHPRAIIMRWASDNEEQHDQSASLPRSPPHACSNSPHWQTHARYFPATTRARIHFKHLARDLDHPRTHAPPLCVGPVRAESSTTSPQASRAPHHACPDSPHWQTQARYLRARTRAFGSTSSNFARTLDHPHTHAPPLCVGPLTTESSTTSAQASRAPRHVCLTPRTLRATWTTRAPRRHHYALRQ
jgi:hypothetical protein